MALKAAYFYIFVLLQMKLTVNSENEEVQLLIETTTGPIRGKVVTGLTQKEGRAFFGIPYAEPPIGNLRFRPPTPVKPWTDVVDATRPAIPCYQQYTKVLLGLSKETQSWVRRPWSEDCLTLNIWAPAVLQEEVPVLIYIQGGYFMVGSGAFPYFDLSTISMESELIMISLNYRVGAFGFLTLGTAEFPGNLGLMDQQLALKWVRDNAAQFGGKLEAIYFAGVGAGAASVGYQVISDKNVGMFKAALMVSGSPTCSWAYGTKEEEVQLGHQLSQSIGCQSENTTAESECLQKAHPEDILDAFKYMPNPGNFKPNIDGTFIKEHPAEAMKAVRFNNVTLFVMNSEKDGSLFFYNINKDILTEPEKGLTEKGFEEAMKRNSLVLTSTELAAVKEWYLKKCTQMNEIEIRDAAVEAYSDGITYCCTQEFSKYATVNGIPTFKIVLALPDPKQPSWIGAHAHVIYDLLNGDALKPEHNFSPEVIMAVMTGMQTTKILSRMKVKEVQEVIPIYNLEEHPYFYFGQTGQHKASNYRSDECVLWNSVISPMRKANSICSNKPTP